MKNRIEQDYRTIVANADEIDAALKAASLDGWSVAFYSPVSVVGQAGVGSIQIVALLARPLKLADMLESI